MATTFSAKLEDGQTSPATSVTSSTETQALITEQQVLFSTAAAVGSFRASAAKPPKRVYPKRHVWLENALMSREMDRL